VTSTASSHPLGDLIDLVKYPLNHPESRDYWASVMAARNQLGVDGCAVINDFVRPQGVTALNQEIVSQKHTTHFSNQAMNPYFHFEHNPHFSDDHPMNTFLERSSGFIPGDSWDPYGPMSQIFRAPEMVAFVAACLEISELHCYADPLAGLTSNILDPGQLFTWHFDTNDFAVTVLVQQADSGGLFEYAPQIRSAKTEGFDRISKILDGGRHEVKTLDLRPGDLQIFQGRHSLHRVSRVSAESCSRHAAIYAYTEKPGVIGRVERTTQLFGRVLPEHLEAERERVRSDKLVD
tara:strand:- start:6061 stop:6936 length:876 start_codon:yes stop_codon:yes gene_type:complete